MVNVYLVLAYGFLWGIFHVLRLLGHRRQQRLEKELDGLKKALGPVVRPCG